MSSSYNKNIKVEDHKEKGKVIQKIMKTYAIVQCFSWPLLMIWYGFLHVNTEMQIIPRQFLRYIFSITRYLTSLNTDYVSFNSLIIAMCRYTFVVFETNAEGFGIDKLKNILICSSVGIPIFRSVLHQCTVPIEDNFLSTFHPLFDEYKNNKSTVYQSDESNVSSHILESPLYTSVHVIFPSAVIWVMKRISDCMVVLIYSNIVEGIIYFHIFIFVKR